jgi:hypothetical protein
MGSTHAKFAFAYDFQGGIRGIRMPVEVRRGWCLRINGSG